MLSYYPPVHVEMHMNFTRWTSWSERVPGTLALLGVLLYVALSVPASIFYSILEVSPQTAGLTYVGVLTGSINGVGIILIVGSIVLFLVAALLAFVSFFVDLINNASKIDLSQGIVVSLNDTDDVNARLVT